MRWPGARHRLPRRGRRPCTAGFRPPVLIGAGSAPACLKITCGLGLIATIPPAVALVAWDPMIVPIQGDSPPTATQVSMVDPNHLGIVDIPPPQRYYGYNLSAPIQVRLFDVGSVRSRREAHGVVERLFPGRRSCRQRALMRPGALGNSIRTSFVQHGPAGVLRFRSDGALLPSGWRQTSFRACFSGRTPIASATILGRLRAGSRPAFRAQAASARQTQTHACATRASLGVGPQAPPPPPERNRPHASGMATIHLQRHLG